MKIKTVVFMLQLFLCPCIVFYSSVIKRYSGVSLNPQRSTSVGFILDISEFKVNDKIYIKLSMNKHDANRNQNYYCLFSNEFSISMDESDLENAKEVNRKSDEVTSGNTKIYYLEITKTEEASYLYFIIQTSSYFSNEIKFKNTKSDENKKIEIILIAVFISFCILIILAAAIVRCVQARKMEKSAKQEEVIVGAQLYNQQQMNNMYNQQPMYGQPQYYGQTQQDQMIVYTQGTNPQENSPNQIETPNQGVVSSNQNNDGGIKDV